MTQVASANPSAVVLDAPSLAGHEVQPVYAKAHLFGLVLGPLTALVLAVAPAIDEAHPKANVMLGITVLTATWWVTQVVPLPVASLLPFILIPAASILPGAAVANLYMNWVVFLFIGSFLVGKALEKTNLHKRIALKFLTRAGSSPRLLLFAFMAVAWFVSMFASNTATTAMLVPFATGVLDKQEDHCGDEEASPETARDDPHVGGGKEGQASTGRSDAAAATATRDGTSADEQVRLRFGKGVLIGIAYGATAGGVATIIGTAPNTVLVSQVQLRFGEVITFGQWFSFGFPVALSILLAAWVILVAMYVPRGDRVSAIKMDTSVFRAAAKAQGPMTRDEKVVALVELIMLVLWFIRPYAISPFVGSCAGNAAAAEKECEAAGGSWSPFLTDGEIACAMALVLFLVPAKTLPPQLDDNGGLQEARILAVKDVADLPWGLFLLFGSGFAISEGFSTSGLSLVIGEALAGLTSLPPALMVTLLALFVCFVTEIASNTATSNIMIAILAPVAVQSGINPYMLLLPSTLAASLAFMLPVATPPNAVVFSTGRILFTDMIKPGFVLNIISVVLLSGLFFAVGVPVFGIEAGVLPEWAVGAP